MRGPQPNYGGAYPGAPNYGSPPGPPAPPKRLDPDSIPSPVSLLVLTSVTLPWCLCIKQLTKTKAENRFLIPRTISLFSCLSFSLLSTFSLLWWISPEAVFFLVTKERHCLWKSLLWFLRSFSVLCYLSRTLEGFD